MRTGHVISQRTNSAARLCRASFCVAFAITLVLQGNKVFAADRLDVIRHFLAGIYPEWTRTGNTMTVTSQADPFGSGPPELFSVVIETYVPQVFYSGDAGSTTTPCITRSLDFPDGRSFSANACEIPAKRTDHPLAEAYFYFGHDGRLVGFLGSLMSVQEKNLAIKDALKAHPESSETAMVRALKQAGARYGPENEHEFLEVIPWGTLKNTLGNVHLSKAKFQFCASPKPDCDPALYWQVSMEKPRRGGGITCFRLLFEPFEGKLTNLAEISQLNDEGSWREIGCTPRPKKQR